jgi:hypothetical protein
VFAQINLVANVGNIFGTTNNFLKKSENKYTNKRKFTLMFQNLTSQTVKSALLIFFKEFVQLKKNVYLCKIKI